MATADSVATFQSKIVPELQALARPIGDCQPHPDNARKHSLPKIAKSLNDHGQRSPIVVQTSTGFIVKGNGTWTAAAQILGWTEIAQQWQDLTDDEALAYLLADNKASDESSYDTPKLVKALQKMADGPGLMDSLWSNEDLEDMLETEAGPTILEGGVDAQFADAETIGKRSERGSASGEKHKEVPLVMSLSEHAEFVERLVVLRKAFGTTGNVATIIEAVRRQAEAEEGAEHVGRDLSGESEAQVRRKLVVELRDLLLTDPRYEELTRSQMLGVLEAAQPMIVSPLRQSSVVEGQTAAFPELEAAPVVEESELDATPEALFIDEDQEAALARYRASQKGK